MRGIILIDILSGASKHTADDWDLIMSSKMIGTPDPRLVKVDMSDRDGEIDLSEVIRGRVSYKNSTLFLFHLHCTSIHVGRSEIRDRRFCPRQATQDRGSGHTESLLYRTMHSH